jgi:hypothetical protein
VPEACGFTSVAAIAIAPERSASAAGERPRASSPDPTINARNAPHAADVSGEDSSGVMIACRMPPF